MNIVFVSYMKRIKPLRAGNLQIGIGILSLSFAHLLCGSGHPIVMLGYGLF